MIKEYKNGNLHVKADELETAGWCDLLTDVAEEDTYLISDVQMLGNFMGYFTLYNVRLDKVYVIRDIDIEDYKNGKTIILNACPPDEYDRELIESWKNGEF